MARYEVVARARLDRHLSTTEYIDLAVKAHSLDTGMRFQRIDKLPDGQIAVVLQRRLGNRKQDAAQQLAHRSLAHLGVPVTTVQQVDLHRMSRKGRTLVRSWLSPSGPAGPDGAGDREPRKPLPSPPYLKAALDLPQD